MDFFPERFGKGPTPHGGLSPVADLLMAVWRDYLARARTYLPIAALTLLAFPFMAAGTLMTVVGVGADGDVLTAEPENFWLFMAVTAVGVAIVAVTNVLAHAALNVAVAGVGKRVPFADVMRRARRVFWPFAATLILLYAAVSVGFSLLFFPGIIVGAFLVFAEPAAAIEGLGPIESLRRSVRLVTGRFWPILWRVSVGYAIVTVGSLALSFPLVKIPTLAIGHLFAGDLVSLRIGLSFTMFAGVAITALILPLFVSLQVHLFNDIKNVAGK